MCSEGTFWVPRQILPRWQCTVLAEAQVLNLVPPSKIGTGICFLDHMVDQLTSHGQLGVTLRCGIVDPSAPSAEPLAAKDCFAPLRDYAAGAASRPHDRDIVVACGSALGLALKQVVDEVAAAAAASADGAAGSERSSEDLGKKLKSFGGKIGDFKIGGFKKKGGES